MDEGVVTILAFVLFFGLVGAVMIWAVLFWRRPPIAGGAAPSQVLDTAVIAHLTRRMSELELQLREAGEQAQEMVKRERADCDRRIELLMGEIARLALKVAALERENGGTAVKAGHSQLYKLMVDRLSEGEIQTAAFHLNIDYDALNGDNGHAKALHLILHVRRLERLADLVALLKRERPDVGWPDIE